MTSLRKPTEPVQKENMAQETVEPTPSEAASYEPQELPMITVTEHSGMDNGFEGVLAHDISEIVDGNPWNENTKLSTLPVYKNSLDYYHYYLVKNADHNAMKSFLLTRCPARNILQKQSLFTGQETTKNTICHTTVSLSNCLIQT